MIVDQVRAEAAARPGQKLHIYDLGSGTGGLCFALARALPDAEVIGLEIAWPAWCFSVLRQKLCRQKNLRYVHADFWQRDIADADIVLCYLGAAVMPRLREKLEQTPKAGRIVISNTFPIPDWSAARVIRMSALLSKQILVYRHSAD